MSGHIRTTQTVVNKLRRIAKTRSKDESLPLHQCLELVAQEYGYAHWKHVLTCREMTVVDQVAEESESTEGLVGNPHVDTLEQLTPGLRSIGFGPKTLLDAKAELARFAGMGVAPVLANPLRGDVFIDVSIEGHRFQGAISSAPYIVLKSKEGSWGGGDCALGVASIAFVKDKGSQRSAPHWAVCKYENQARIDLTDLSDAGRRALAIEFGLDTIDHEHDPLRDGDGFFGSKAYTALVAWAKRHPRKITQYEANSYLGMWALAATIDAGLKPNKRFIEWLEQVEIKTFGTLQAQHTWSLKASLVKSKGGL